MYRPFYAMTWADGGIRGRQEPPPDHLGDGGHDGVAEGSTTVQPMGNPIIRSSVVGGGEPPVPTISCSLRHPGHFIIEGEHWLADAVGVGKSEQPAS